MAKKMDPILSILSILGYWAIILGTFGGPGEDFQRIPRVRRDPFGLGPAP